MSAVHKLITDHLDIWTAADTEKKSGRGRASGNANSVYGIKKLRELILELAVRGKLVPQDPNDEPASELLKRIQAEKAKLIAERKIKKDKLLSPIAEGEEHYELPSNWIWTRLGEITNFGITEKLEQIADDMWVLDLEDIEKDTSKLLQKFRFAVRRSLSDKNSFRVGDVLYGKLRPYLNKVIVADELGVCTTEILPIRCYSTLDSDYLKNVLKSPSFVSYVNARSYGMKMPRLGTEDGRKAAFPLPPLAEQHRIVAKVDELMALCDQLEAHHNNAADAHEQLVSHLLGTLTQSQDTQEFNANWQRIAEHFDTLFTTESSIDTLKQTLLQLAVMGKLVPQDPNDEPASELLKRIQDEKAKLVAEGKIKKDKPLAAIGETEKPFELPSSWEWAHLQEITTGMDSGWSPACLENCSPSDTVWGVLKTTSVQIMEYLEYENKELPEKLVPRPEAEVKAGDILFTRAGPTNRVAISCLVETTRPRLMISDKIIRFHPVDIGVDGSFLTLCLNTGATARFLEKAKSGMAASQVNISQEKLRLAPIPVPPLKLQHRIVTKVNELMALCEQLKSRIIGARQYQQKLSDVLTKQGME